MLPRLHCAFTKALYISVVKSTTSQHIAADAILANAERWSEINAGVPTSRIKYRLGDAFEPELDLIWRNSDIDAAN
jgi:hypothetical protein